MILRTCILLTAVCIYALVSFPRKDSSSPPSKLEFTTLGTNRNKEVTESSGLAFSRQIPDAIWTINDSGNSDRAFLLHTDGRLLAEIKLKGADNNDWEALADFEFEGKPHLMIADVGDNSGRRKSYQLYFFPEPDLSEQIESAVKTSSKKTIKATLKPKQIQFKYEDGPRDCEAIGIDTDNQKIWLVEKISFGASRKKTPGIYALDFSLKSEKKTRVAKRIADFPIRNVTGMDFSNDGKSLIIRNYLNAHMYTRLNNQPWSELIKETTPETVVLPLQRQGEAICFTPDSQAMIVTSEFTQQPIWKIKRTTQKAAEK